jgi:MSHA biogenesis protein MshN
LTSPIEDNAYNFYQKILALDSNNHDALEGLDSIAARYLRKAEEAAQQRNLQQAETFLQRARFVSARYVHAHEPVFQQSIHSVIEGRGYESELQKSAATSASVVSSLPTSNGSVGTELDTIKPFLVTEMAPTNFRQSADSLDVTLVQKAEELMAQGKMADAMNQLKVFVANEKKAIRSATLLAEIYLQQGNLEAASILANQLVDLPDDVKTKVKAQVMVATGDHLNAISLLEKNIALAEANEAYRALLASLYQKNAMYAQSAVSYQRLMHRFGEKPSYWLGLALAYDGLQKPQNALAAYERLGDYPQLQEQVRSYVLQRISALRGK